MTHLPFRSWCPVCLQARSKEDHHTTQTYDKRPVLQMDYGFMVCKHTGDQLPVLTCLDCTTSGATASIVPHKGVNDYAQAELRRFILEWARNDAVLQTDQENSIMALARAVATSINIALRQAPKYSSESQGSVERFHSTLWAMVRTLLLVVRTNYGVELRMTDDLVTWAVKHAVWLYNRYQVHSD